MSDSVPCISSKCDVCHKDILSPYGDQMMYIIHGLVYDGVFSYPSHSELRVGPSTIADGGNGVFATANLPSHTICDYYPNHYLAVEISNGTTGAIPKNRYLTHPPTAEKMQQLFHSHSIKACGTTTIGEPTIHTGNTGHLINDPTDLTVLEPLARAVHQNPSVENYQAFMTAAATYYDKANVNFTQPCNYPQVHKEISNVLVAIVTLRAIKTGEELMVAYGGEYWLEFLLGKWEPDHSKVVQLVRSLKPSP